MTPFVHIIRKTLRAVHSALCVVGALVLLVFGLCFTSAPWRIIRWLAEDGSVLAATPNYIVVFGGGGIPSESGLTRAFAAARAAHEHPDATVILALPYDTELGRSAAGKMRDELVLRGVEAARIRIEPKGRNTREQALNLARQMQLNPEQDSLLVVTSPEHMRRALLALRRVGFRHVAGRAAHSESIEMNVLYDPDELGGSTVRLPGGESLMVRYQFWNNLGYLSSAAREVCALFYYRVRGWI